MGERMDGSDWTERCPEDDEWADRGEKHAEREIERSTARVRR